MQEKSKKKYLAFLTSFKNNRSFNTFVNGSGFLINKIINIIKNLDIPIIDIYKELHLTLEDPMALYPFGLKDQHYNELGYGLIAETILNKIDEYDRLEKE